VYPILIISAIAFFISGGLNAQKNNISKDDLPHRAQSFLANYFSNERLVQAEKDMDGFKTHYEIKLSNGTELEFDEKGYWKEIDGKDKVAIPQEFIPKKISQYITQHFAPHRVSKIEKDRNKYEVELTNGMDLEFSLNGD